MVRRNTRKTTRQQQRILDAFKNESTVEIIPAKRGFTDVKTIKLRMVAYCRVSTFEFLLCIYIVYSRFKYKQLKTMDKPCK